MNLIGGKNFAPGAALVVSWLMDFFQTSAADPGGALDKYDAFAKKFPKVAAQFEDQRFSLAVIPDLRKVTRGTRELEVLARNHPVTMARITPFGVDLPPNHRLYYYVYAKCIELDLPISINTGLPGPPVPGECQNPIHLDRVCYELPELKLCMAHGADPWWDVAIRLMIKYKNLVLTTSAYSPKYFPDSLIHYMNTRGKQKILFASDHPVLPMERCIREARELPLRPGVLDNFLYRNAARFFWGESFDE